MKKLLVALTVMMAALTLPAEDVLLKSWDLNKKDDCALWFTKSKCTQAVENNALKVTVDSNEGSENITNIQLMPVYKGGFTANVKYRVEATVTASAGFMIGAQVIQNGDKFARIAKEAEKYTVLKADQPANIVIEFTPTEDAKTAYRVPCFFLGKAPAGTVIVVSNVKLFEVK